MDMSTKNNALILKFSLILDLTEEEKSILLSLQNECDSIPPQTDIVVEGEDLSTTYIVQSGWTYTYKLLPDGKQQILNFNLCGDIIGPYAMVLKQADHSVRTLTETKLFKVDPEKLLDLLSESPRLAVAIFWSAARDGAILGEQVTRIGRRPAYERMAHLLLELLRRLESVGLVVDDKFDFPLTQELLADTLGLTSVHVNRTIRALKKDGLINYKSDLMKIINQDGLRKVADFDANYLEQTDLPDEIASHLDP